MRLRALSHGWRHRRLWERTFRTAGGDARSDSRRGDAPAPEFLAEFLERQTGIPGVYWDMAKFDGRFAEKLKGLWPYLLVALVGLSAYFLTRLAIPEGKSITRDEEGIPRQASHPQQEEPVKQRKTERGKSGALDLSAIDNGTIPNQRIVVFKNQAALNAFLAGMGDGVSVLGRLDRMNALLVGFGNEADLTALLDGTEETGFNFPASIPEFESVGAQDGAVAFGSDLMKWLGLEGDNSLWGLA